MYIRPAFEEKDLTRIVGLITEHNFGVLITENPITVSHIPFTANHDGETITLQAHLAAANPQCTALNGGTAVAVFTGPHAYISPSWYQTQPAVPTWDYAAVYVHGTLEPIIENGPVLDALAAIDPAGFRVAKLDDDYRTMMYRGIRSFRLRGTRIEAQWKMSQNRSKEDRTRVAAALRAQGDTTVADIIDATLDQ